MRGPARAGSLQTVPAAARSAAALRLPRQPRRPRARSSPGSRAAGSGRRDPVPRRVVGPAGTAAGGRSLLLLLLFSNEVRATGSGRSRRARHPRGEMHAEGIAEGAGSWARARRACTEGGAARGFRLPPAWVPWLRPLCGIRECSWGRALRRPPAWGSPSQGRQQAPRALGKEACGLFKGLSRGGFGGADWRRAAGDGRWALGPRRSLVGSRCGCGPGWGPRDRGARGGLSHRPVGRKKKGGWPGAQKRRDAADRRSGLGD